MHIVRHLRALADRSSYSHRTRLVKGGHNPRTGEIWEPRTRKRAVRRRVKRWRNRGGYGYILVNDSLSLIPDIARLIAYYGQAYIVDDDPDYFGLEDPGPLSVPPDISAAGARWEQLALHYFADDIPGYVNRLNDDRSLSVEPLPVP